MINIHPAFVHFPIALLLVYAFFELLSATRAKNWPHIQSTKHICLLFGTLGAFASLQTGEIAEEAFSGSDATLHQLIETHSLWANISTIVFTAILLARLIVWLAKQPALDRPNVSIFKRVLFVLVPLAKRIEQVPVVQLLAAFGLIAITITGALGAAIVYGPEVDPLVQVIYSLLIT